MTHDQGTTMPETITTEQSEVDVEPKHALRRHLTGRYHTGLIPVAVLVKAHPLQGRSHSRSEHRQP